MILNGKSIIVSGFNSFNYYKICNIYLFICIYMDILPEVKKYLLKQYKISKHTIETCIRNFFMIDKCS